jgi:hypothetical protein
MLELPEVVSFIQSLNLSLCFFLSLLIYPLVFQAILMFLSSSATTYSIANYLFAPLSLQQKYLF